MHAVTLSPVTKTMATWRSHREDNHVLTAIENLPLADDDAQQQFSQRAGVANEQGQVYRYIVVSSAFQLLVLTARLNALGFAVSAELRAPRRRLYDCVFFKTTGRRGA